MVSFVFTESFALLKLVKKLIFLREKAVFKIMSQFSINKTQNFPAIIAYFKNILSSD